MCFKFKYLTKIIDSNVYIYTHLFTYIYFREFPCSCMKVHVFSSIKEHALLAAFRVCENSWQTTLLQKALKIILVLAKTGAYTQSAC